MANNTYTYINKNQYEYPNATVSTNGSQNTTTTGGRTDTNTSNTDTTTNSKADQALKNAYNTTALRNANDFGISSDFLDQDKLYQLYTQGAQTTRDVGLQELAAARNQQAQGLTDAQNAYIDTIRKANAGAIQSGASKGVQAANELSALLGFQQESVAGNTQLAQQRYDIGNTYAKALADAATNAESTAYNRATSIADILNAALASDSNLLGMLGYGSLGDYLASNIKNNTKNTANTGQQVTTENVGGTTQYTTYG